MVGTKIQNTMGAIGELFKNPIFLLFFSLVIFYFTAIYCAFQGYKEFKAIE